MGLSIGRSLGVGGSALRSVTAPTEVGATTSPTTLRRVAGAALPAVMLTGAATGAALMISTRSEAGPAAEPAAAPTYVAGAGRANAPAISKEYAQFKRTIPTAATDPAKPADFARMLAQNEPGWASADGVYSVDLKDGRVLWMFGDTMLNTHAWDWSVRPNAAMVRNSAILQNGKDITTLTRGNVVSPTDFMKPANPDQWYWPGHGVTEGNNLVLFLGKVKKTEAPGGWNFGFAGSDVAILDKNTLALKSQSALPVPKGREVTWGTFVVEDKTHTYIYGMEGGPNPFDRWAVVARTAPGKVGAGAWEYWDGKSWSKDVNKTHRLRDGVSNQYSVVKSKEGYTMLSQELFFGTGLLKSTSPTPTGPWTPWKKIDSGPSLVPKQISYNATAHPEFRNRDASNGALLVGWSMNLQNAQLPTPAQNYLYQPKFRTIAMQRESGQR